MPDATTTRPPSQELRDAAALVRLGDHPLVDADAARHLADLLDELADQARTSEGMLGALLASLGEGGYPPAVRGALRLARALLA